MYQIFIGTWVSFCGFSGVDDVSRQAVAPEPQRSSHLAHIHRPFTSSAVPNSGANKSIEKHVCNLLCKPYYSF